MKPFGMISIPVAVGLLLLTQNLEAQMHASKASLKSKKAKIQNAMSAAPKVIAKDATIAAASGGRNMPMGGWRGVS
jgi:hypothetical protein